eukprot:COSAG04_NODE_595_length_12255_cov_246.957716_8_plen_81_part_00
MRRKPQTNAPCSVTRIRSESAVYAEQHVAAADLREPPAAAASRSHKGAAGAASTAGAIPGVPIAQANVAQASGLRVQLRR